MAMENAKGHFLKFLLLWSGSFISAIGSGLTAFGLGVYIFGQTGKSSLMALITLLGFLPSLLLGIPAGVLADRYDRRLLMVIGDSFSAIGLLFILFCMRIGDAQVWQICVGVTISSVFASLLEPSYKATISDLLTPEQYSKASGLVQITGSAKYLISPILAGFLLSIWDVRLLLILDICTFFVTVTATLTVRKGLQSKKMESSGSFMAIFGLRENIWLIGISGFLFFAMLPPANASLDYLIRTNIRNELQGRAWGLIGFFSQMGYVVAYAASGLLADYLFTPLLMPGGLLAGTIGKVFGTGTGRGIGFLITLAGAALCVSAVVLFKIKSIQKLEVWSAYER